MEQNVIALQKELEVNYKEQDKNQSYKFAVSLSLANPESLDVLKKHNVVIKKPCQTIVLLIDPVELERELKLAEEMGFIAAYQQNPRHLTQPVEMVIKRMAKAESVGVTYKNEKGTYASFLFSQRAFDYIIKGNTKENTDTPSVAPVNDNLDITEIKEDALRVLETFALADEKDKVYQRLEEIKDKGLSEKEMLLESFKIFGGDEALLISTIDEVLAQKNEKKAGR